MKKREGLALFSKAIKKTIEKVPLDLRFTALIIVFTIIPITAFSGIFIRKMESDVVKESRLYVSYRKQEESEQIQNDIDSIRMATRFFQNDETLISVLNLAKSGGHMSTSALIDFHNGDVADLNRMVSNNPALYSVRVYSNTDNVVEMMSVLYKYSRMKLLSWGNDTNVSGWHFNYDDTSFGNLTKSYELVSLVTPITVYDYGTVGYIESVMQMQQMFPEMYSDKNDEWAFLIDSKGKIIHGKDWAEERIDEANSIIKDRTVLVNNGIYRKDIGKRSFLISSEKISDMGSIYIGVQDITDSMANARRTGYILIAVISALMLLLSFMVNFIVRRMLSRINSVEKTMRIISEGNMKVRTSITGDDDIGEMGNTLNGMLDQIEKLMNENVEREILAKNAGIKSLQNQINAHFIYNVLESIKMQAEVDEEYMISDSITSLEKLLRYSINWGSGIVSIRDELNYIKNYILLMNSRNDFVVTLAIDIPEQFMNQEIPKMSLQPVVENAVLHGIAPIGEDASIYIHAVAAGNDIRIEISDNGYGMTEEVLEKLRNKLNSEVDTNEKKGHGVGMKNIQDRIKLNYGQNYGLRIFSEEGRYTKVVISLPRKEMN
ncbi:MAG: sensor histidine kinase [Candidatus Weimeria sp.]